jgi:hypothetical protein
MAQPSSGSLYKLTERDHEVLKRAARKNSPLLQHSPQSSKMPLEASSAQFVGSFMKWVSMAGQPHTSLRSL